MMSPRQPVSFSDTAAAALAEDLRRRIQGEVRFDAGSRALYATDGSNYRQAPIGVVIPRSVEDIVATMAVCREHQAPVLARGGGTSLAGQCCNNAVIMDMSKYLNRVLEINPDERYARVEPGCVLDDLRNQAEQYHLTFGPDPSTHDHNCLGGMIGNNSCGVHSVMAGRTVDNVEALEILTYDGLRFWVGPTSDEELDAIIRQGGRKGEIYTGLKAIRDQYTDLIRQRYPQIPRRVSGYNLDELLPEKGFNVARALVGTEGTCVSVLQAKLRLIHSPPARVLLVLGYPDIYSAGDHVPKILQQGPVGLEGIDQLLIDYMKRKRMHPEDRELLPEGGGWLLVEFGGETEEAAVERARQTMEDLKKENNPPHMKLFDDDEEEAMVWEIRESGLGATAHVPGERDTWPGWEDAAVAPEKVGDYLREFRDLLQKYDYDCSLYGHFGDGCIHVRIDFDLFTEPGIKNFLAFTDEAADLVLKYNGSLSGEHGDGQARADLLPKMYGAELIQAFQKFKAVWDPLHRMNPGKVVEPYRRDENLRIGPDYHPIQVDTFFRYPDDGDDFAKVTQRCVGVGKCRHINKGVMCPSYMATREEMHSTRGRARLLFEMLQGDPLKDLWKSEAVHEALDLCLSCKGCKGDCPVNVDMATYKAEFYYHYYQGRLRPRAAYAMGLIHRWSRWASVAPRAVNFFSQTPGFRDIGKWLGGIAPQRQLPKFAPQTFRSWFLKRGVRNEGGPKLLLWPDTFNNHLRPQVLIAAVEVLEVAGYQVIIPQQPLCCGRPLYEWGWLDRAKNQLTDILVGLPDEVAQGIPIVGVEPACLSVFKDELINLFPQDERAKQLSRQSFLLSEFLINEGYQPPQLHRKALVHVHCNHHAIFKPDKEKQLLSKLGLDFEFLKNAGCCGMAGSFGFEKKHYDISMKIGERILLPAVREADPETMILTSGYICSEQINQSTKRQPLHLAQVLQLALNEVKTS